MTGVPSPETIIREALILAQSLPLSVPEAHFESLKRLDGLVLQTLGAPAFAALDALVADRDQARAELRAATDMLVAAEKIAPGVMQTSGRFALGDVAEARTERDAAVERTSQLTAALLDLRTMLTGMAPTGVKLGRVLLRIDVALAAVGEPPSEPEPVSFEDFCERTAWRVGTIVQHPVKPDVRGVIVKRGGRNWVDRDKLPMVRWDGRIPADPVPWEKLVRFRGEPPSGHPTKEGAQ